MPLKQVGKFGLDKMLVQFTASKPKFPKVLANMAKNHFLEGFENEGGATNDSKGGWKPRKYNRGKQRKLLVLTGALRLDIKVRFTTWAKTVVGTSSLTSDYAENQNEGKTVIKREYIGKSDILEKKLKARIYREINKMFPKKAV